MQTKWLKSYACDVLTRICLLRIQREVRVPGSCMLTLRVEPLSQLRPDIFLHICVNKHFTRMAEDMSLL